MRRRPGAVLARILAAVLVAAAAAAAGGASVGARAEVPAPESVLGFAPCADYKLATSDAIATYLRRLDAASDRVLAVDIGRTTAGRPHVLLIVSSEQNLRHLARYRSIARTLALARHEGRVLDEAEARTLAAEGRAVVWIDFGLHSTEVAPAQTAPWLAHHLATDESEASRAVREHTILILMPDLNPDGTTLVADWYMKHVGTPYERSAPPELYHPYAGHDNNRDWFMFNLVESANVARQLYHEWFPQIVYNHHQAAPFPARIFVPPFADPMNPHLPPLVMRGIATLGDAITRRLEQEGKTGAISRIGFDTWWNGGMRTAPAFHNMIGILTETAHASASPATYDAASFPRTFANGWPTLEPTTSYPSPYRGGPWRLRDSCDYMLSASLAVLEAASRQRAEWLLDIYRMGRDAIRAGASEHYIVPADQWDASAAWRLVEALVAAGIEVERAREGFTAGGRTFGAGSYVIRGAQPFLPYVRDLLTPQRYPDRPAVPGGQLDRPYDVAGWTLPLQMGVRVDRIDGPVSVPTGPVLPDRPRDAGDAPPAPGGYALDPRATDAYRAVNRLLKTGVAVGRLVEPLRTDGASWPAGTFLVGASDGRALVQASTGLQVSWLALAQPPAGARVALGTPRVAVYRPWGGNMDEGWTRYVLDRFEFPYSTVRDEDIRSGDLRRRADVIVLPDASADAMLRGPGPGAYPPEYLGGMTPRGIAHLFEFVAGGGTLVAIDSAIDLPLAHFGLPFRNALEGLRPSEFSIPGSIVMTELDPGHPLGWGLPRELPAYFNRSAAMQFVPAPSPDPDAPGSLPQGRVVGRYGGAGTLLLSGWARGTDRLGGQIAYAVAPVERGRVVLIGPRPVHRGQSYGTFKLLFNALWLP